MADLPDALALPSEPFAWSPGDPSAWRTITLPAEAFDELACGLEARPVHVIDEWPPNALEGLKPGSVTVSGFWDAGLNDDAEWRRFTRLMTEDGRCFRTRRGWRIRLRRWVPFDRSHHATPGCDLHALLMARAEGTFEERVVAAVRGRRRFTRMHSAYRHRSRRRTR